MAEYIDKDSLIRWLTGSFLSNCEDCTEIECVDCIVHNCIKTFATADVEPVKRSKWCLGKDIGEHWGTGFDNSYKYFCFECKAKAIYDIDNYGDDTEPHLTDYCPICGARMDGDKK